MNHSDAQTMQSYPSPTTGPADNSANYYSHSGPPQSPNLTAEEFNAGPNMNVGSLNNAPERQDHRGHAIPNHTYDGIPPQIHSPQEGNEQTLGYHQGDSEEAPRKRSKISRACDECRRKKIKCDATGDDATEVCTNCKRVNNRCAFTRQPMKRGPSKGYIKELADRVVALEHGNLGGRVMQSGDMPISHYATHHHPEATLEHRDSEEYATQAHIDMNRKRTYSTVSNEYTNQYTIRSQAGWAAQDPPRQAVQNSGAFSPPQGISSQQYRDQDYSPNSLQQAAAWRAPPEAVMRRHSSSLDGGMPMDHNLPDNLQTWDTETYDSYKLLIHSTYPILYHSTENIEKLLAACSHDLKIAFYTILHATLRSLLPPSGSGTDSIIPKVVLDSITASQFENPTFRSFASNMVSLQILILMAIQAISRGPGHEHSSSVSLGNAVTLAYSMKIHVYKRPQNIADSEEHLVRRIWLTLIMMDRWHAVSTSSPVRIPEEAISMYPEDQTTLGDELYHLARLSIVAGHFAAVNSSQTVSSSPFAFKETIQFTLLKGELDRCREGYPPSFSNPDVVPLLHLCHLYLRVQLHIIREDEPAEVLAVVSSIVALLSKQEAVATSPLSVYVASLAAAILLELSENIHMKYKATSDLSVLAASHIACPQWDAAIKETLRKHRITDTMDNSTASQQALASQTLRHLAELATAPMGEEGRENIEQAEHVRPSSQNGLKALLRDGHTARFGA